MSWMKKPFTIPRNMFQPCPPPGSILLCNSWRIYDVCLAGHVNSLFHNFNIVKYIKNISKKKSWHYLYQIWHELKKTYRRTIAKMENYINFVAFSIACQSDWNLSDKNSNWLKSSVFLFLYYKPDSRNGWNTV